MSRLNLALAALLLCQSGALAQGPKAAPGPSPLGVRQRHAERMMAELERKFIELKLALLASEPERAERLQLALNRAKELLVQQRMDDVVKLLDADQLEQAADSQRRIRTDLRALADLLENESNLRQQARDEFARLGQWKAEIEKYLRAEQALRQASAAPFREPPEALAKRQRELAAQTDQLGRQMQQPSPSRQRQAGAQSVQQAQQSMQRAADALGQQQSADARQEQDQAIDQLEQARRQVNERMAELGDSAQAQTLANLEQAFREMLATQQQLTLQTAALEQKRQAAGGQLGRADRNALRAIGETERRLKAPPADPEDRQAGLAGQAQQALDSLPQDGDSAALAAAVGQLRDKLVAVGGLVADQLRSDAPAASAQHEIEQGLEALIAAVQQISAQSRRAAQELAGQKQPGTTTPAQRSEQGPAGQGGASGGGSRGTDQAAAAQPALDVPQNPWNQLRDRSRDPVFSAIEQKFPARYQQLLEQYYKSFQDSPGDQK